MNWVIIRSFLLISGVFLINQISVSQIVNLEGYVTDKKQHPIVLSRVVLNKQKTETTTNHKGYFSINSVNLAQETLVFSCLGYRNQTVDLKDFLNIKNPITITLQDSVNKLEEFVVSAPRVTQIRNQVAVPSQVISAAQIKGKGMVRLNEVLAEQSGLQIVNDHGLGLQMQGLSSDYILILVDGEPVIGRTAGTLDLSRIAVGNIERVEIMKGPSSSLYGNEALAGVVNIITTKNSHQNSLNVNALLRTNNTINTGIEARLNEGRLNTSIFLDRLSSDGYDLNNEVVGKTAPAFTAYTFKPKVSYKFSEYLTVGMYSLYFTDNQENNSIVKRGSNTIALKDKALRNDFVLVPSVLLTLSPKHQIALKNSVNIFGSSNQHLYVTKQGVYDESHFSQLLNRSELKYDWSPSARHSLIAGAGYVFEKVSATRYEGQKGFNSSYIFVQHNGKLSDKISISPSSRYDFSNQYGSSFSPKIAMSYRPKSWLDLDASVGTGFKTPDFRQLLLNFTNPTVGYSVFGSKLAQEKTEDLVKNGEITAILTDLEMLGDLKPERSLAFNFGISLNFSKEVTLKTNLFLNKISNLIEHAPIARKTSGEYVYSYFNKNRVITEGIESSLGWNLSKNFSTSVSYQCLFAKDLDMLDLVKSGKVYRKNSVTGETERVKVKDYGGLSNRSKHSGNFKAAYQNRTYHFKCALRGVYRGSWGIGDLNGNKIIDTSEEYAKGYLLWNLSLNQRLFKRLALEGGVMNLLGTKSPHDTSLSGRLWYAGVQLNLTSKK